MIRTLKKCLSKTSDMKKLTILILIFSIVHELYAQKVISAKSEKKSFTYTPVFKRELPPNLFVKLSFEDDNNNGILEAEENAILNLLITNKGKGKAQDLLVKVEDDKYDNNFHIEDGINILYLLPGESKEISIPISAGFDVKSFEHKLKITVTEHFGYDMDPAYLILNSLKFQEPKLVFSGLEIIDKGEGTGAIEQDGQLQAGEQVKVKIIIQNIGQNISNNTRFEVTTTNKKNIYIDDGVGTIGDIKTGEVKDFFVTISPNKRVVDEDELPIFLSLKNDYDIGNIENFQLPIILNKRPPNTQIVEVKPDLDKIYKPVARFEYSSTKISTNIGNIIDIEQFKKSASYRPNSVAVIIGIENYQNFVSAPYAEKDAKIMKKYFESVLGIQNIYIYTNEEVSGSFFPRIFNPVWGELQRAVIKGETELFIFYSGHGMPSKDGSKVYLFPHDGIIEGLSDLGYDLNKFYSNLQELGAKKVMIFLDACFSGLSRSTEKFQSENLMAMKGIAIKPDLTQPWENDSTFMVFSSSAYNETSLGFDQSQTGLFTYFVCAGLQGKADADNDNKITTGELFSYIKENVIETSKKIRGIQTPQFYGNNTEVLVEY